MLNGRFALFIIVVFFLIPKESKGQEGFDFSGVRYSEYRGVKRIAQYIVNTYPPSEYHYVGLGASPSGVLAYLQLKLGLGFVTHLPMTSVGLIGHRYYQDRAESQEFRQVVRTHFDYFLPEQKYQNKKIVNPHLIL